MPAMTHGLSGEEIEAVIAYLGSLGKGLSFRKERHANAERGSALYHEKGCIACHEPTPDYRGPHSRGDAFDSAIAVAHPDLKKKTSLLALHHFLMQPSMFRSDGRMPHLSLDKQEAMDIAAHLVDFQPSDPREAGPLAPWPKVKPDEIARGEELVRAQNCAACHDLPNLKETLRVEISQPAQEASCLSGRKQPGLPYYDLTSGQRDSLLLFLSQGEKANHSDLTFAAMNCFACHERDGVGGATAATNPYFIGEESLGDSGRIPPPLTGIGHKLLPEWMERVFRGDEGSRVRSYLKTEMPNYEKHATALTNWLQEIDAKTAVAKPPVEDLEAGQKLLGVHGGVNCITCHDWGEQKSLGIPALDISNLDERLRPDWFSEYLLNPSSYRPGTLMPPLWRGGQSSVPDILEGDARRQIAAIWSFISEGEGVPEGAPDRSSGQFELVPKDQPIIQRTFFHKTGSKAILVGFPGEVHIAYNAEAGGPALVWRGRFFDAYDTWFTRAAPFGDPLSEEIHEFGGEGPSYQFRGYELDAKGNPTFLIADADRQLKESFSVEGGKLIRTIRWTKGETPALGHPAGVERKVSKTEMAITVTYFWKGER